MIDRFVSISTWPVSAVLLRLLTLIWLVLMALFFAANRRDSVSLLRFQYWQVLFLPLFLTYRQLTSSLECKALCIGFSFFVLWSICLSSSLVHFKIGLKYLMRETAWVFIPFIKFLLYSLISNNFLFFWDTLFYFIPFTTTSLMVSASNILKYFWGLFLRAFWLQLDFHFVS